MNGWKTTLKLICQWTNMSQSSDQASNFNPRQLFRPLWDSSVRFKGTNEQPAKGYLFIMLKVVTHYRLQNIWLLRMITRSSRNVQFLAFIFLFSCFKKSLLIRLLKRNNQFILFWKLEQCNKKQIKCEGSIEFLWLCDNFGLSPTFSKVRKGKSNRWKKSSANLTRNVISEEVNIQVKKNLRLEKELISEIYSQIHEQCSSFRYLCILYTIDNLCKKQFQDIANGHAKKIARLLHKKFDVDKHITNISSYKLSFSKSLRYAVA